MALLEINNLSVYYYTLSGVVRAVESVELRLDPGEKLAVVGESGSGKSTLGLTIAGLLPPPGRVVSGSIKFKGRELTKLSKEEWRKVRGREITIIFQDPNTALNPVMKVGDQVAEILLEHGYDKREAVEEAVSLLKTIGIPDPQVRYHSYPHQLSGGMKQRVMIAIAIALKPSLIIADEPTSALDVTIQSVILKLLYNLSLKFNSSLILITHDLGVAYEIADTISVLYAGQLAEVGKAEDIIQNPLHPYTKKLLESIPFTHKSKSKLKAIPGRVPSLISPPLGCRFHPRCAEAREECRKRAPPLYRVGDRLVACHLYG